MELENITEQFKATRVASPIKRARASPSPAPVARPECALMEPEFAQRVARAPWAGAISTVHNGEYTQEEEKRFLRAFQPSTPEHHQPYESAFAAQVALRRRGCFNRIHCTDRVDIEQANMHPAHYCAHCACVFLGIVPPHMYRQMIYQPKRSALEFQHYFPESAVELKRQKPEIFD